MVVGGGQLARMMQQPAIALGVTLRAIVESAQGSTAQVVPDSPVAAPADLAVRPDLVEGAAALTFEHEHVPAAALAAVAEAGVPVRPGPHALRYAQNKLDMRERLTELGIPCPAWAAVSSVSELDGFGAANGWPVVLKTPTGGYDGKGVRFIERAADAQDWFEAAGGAALLAESKVAFRRELAALVARRPSGEVRAWPVVQTLQRDGVCAEVIAPAPGLDPGLAEHARDVAVRIAEGLDVTGVLAVEMFEIDGALVVNELAMRPHNSGHWTIDGAVTSQFEQHLRAVLDLPLGSPEARQPVSVMVNLLGSELPDPADALPEALAVHPEAKVHLYGKEVRPGRKLGHVTVNGDDAERALAEARAVVALLRGEG